MVTKTTHSVRYGEIPIVLIKIINSAIKPNVKGKDKFDKVNKKKYVVNRGLIKTRPLKYFRVLV